MAGRRRRRRAGGRPEGAAWLELKCGASHEALCACAWDAPKLALALRVGRASVAYLLAATTDDHWRDGVRGSELFADYREEDTVANRRRFADWWRTWERRPDPLPVRLPARYATELLASESFAVGSTGYELRLARVTVVGDDDYEWEAFGSG